MKKLLLVVAALFTMLVVDAQSAQERHWKKNVEKVRIISYNILNGFDWGKDLEREARLVEWMKGQDPEVVALEELCGFTQAKLEALAKRWGHPYAAIVKENGYPVGITSRQPIEVVNKLVNGYGHGLLHVKTYGFDFFVTHLNPSSTATRQVEAQRIMAYAKKNNVADFMLMGDMNSHSPFDADYMESHAVELAAKYGGAASQNLMDGHFDYAPIATFLAYPLIDICRLYVAPENRTSFPTPVLMNVSKHPSVREKTAERLDFILTTPAIAKLAVDGFIWNDETTAYLSDHYPVGIDLLVEKKVEKK